MTSLTSYLRLSSLLTALCFAGCSNGSDLAPDGSDLSPDGSDLAPDSGLRTADGAIADAKNPLPPDSSTLADASPPNADAGPINFPTGPAVCTEDDWCWVQLSPQGAWLNAVHIFADDEVWIVGKGGTVLRWDGTAFGRAPTQVHRSFHDLWGASRDDVWVVGSGPVAMHFDGQSWQELTLGNWGAGMFSFNGAGGSSSSNVWLVGDQGTALPTHPTTLVSRTRFLACEARHTPIQR